MGGEYSAQTVHTHGERVLCADGAHTQGGIPLFSPGGTHREVYHCSHTLRYTHREAYTTVHTLRYTHWEAYTPLLHTLRYTQEAYTPLVHTLRYTRV